MRSSFSCARRRRLRCLPSPAASSIRSRRSRGLRVDDRLDAALRDDRVHLLAEPGVRQHVDHVDEPAARAVQAVLALAVAVELAQDRDLGELGRQRRRRRCRSRPRPRRRCEPLIPWPPAKITSCIVWPRTASGLCSPSAQSTASVTFDLPDPFGPTITDTPGRELELRAVGERLEALDRDRAQVHQPPTSPERVEGLQRGLLLGALLRLALRRGRSPRPRPRRPRRSCGRAAGPSSASIR